MHILTQLISLIDAQVEQNGGAPGYEDKEPRGHLGASVIGRDCWREIYYSWRWFSPRQFEGRMLRLFARGHREEQPLSKLLELVGAKVHLVDPVSGKQFRFSACMGHFGGSSDGEAENVPGSQEYGVTRGERILTEYKTWNLKTFDKLLEDGLRKTKPEHYGQMCTYMAKRGLRLGLYIAVCKNDDRLFMCFVRPDPAHAEELENKAGHIIRSSKPPPRISESPSAWACKFCDHRLICHYGQEPQRNCRTCRFSYPAENAEWKCQRWNHATIPFDAQQVGCDAYMKILD